MRIAVGRVVAVCIAHGPGADIRLAATPSPAKGVAVTAFVQHTRTGEVL